MVFTGETDEDVLVDSAITELGLSRLSEFDPNTRIIEWATGDDMIDKIIG